MDMFKGGNLTVEVDIADERVMISHGIKVTQHDILASNGIIIRLAIETV